MTDQTNPEYPSTRADLIERIESSWSNLMLVIEGMSNLTFDQPGPGGWTPKDNLAHLMEWERYMLRRILRGESLESALEIDREAIKDLDEDGINNLLYLRNKERFPGDVLDLLKMTHQAVMEELAKVDYDWLLQKRDPNKPDQAARISHVIGNTYEHFDEHRMNIEAVVNEGQGGAG